MFSAMNQEIDIEKAIDSGISLEFSGTWCSSTCSSGFNKLVDIDIDIDIDSFGLKGAYTSTCLCGQGAHPKHTSSFTFSITRRESNNTWQLTHKQWIPVDGIGNATNFLTASNSLGCSLDDRRGYCTRPMTRDNDGTWIVNILIGKQHEKRSESSIIVYNVLVMITKNKRQRSSGEMPSH